MKYPRLVFLGIMIGALLAMLVAVRITKNHRIPASPAETKLRIVTSFYPLYFFTKEITGEFADVRNSTPAGAEPHDYEPTTQDVARIEYSNVVILNGRLEPWADKMKGDLVTKNISIITATDGLPLHAYTNEEGESAQDPHVWLDPVLAKTIVDHILDGIVHADPAHADDYQANALRLKHALDELDASFKTSLAACTQKNLVTSHAAFGYLAKRYGLAQIAITGLSPDIEPSAKDLAEVTEFARRERIGYIFFESLVSPKLSETIAREVGAKTLVLNPIEGLTPKEIASGKNYFTVMSENLKNLRLALDCK